MFYKKNIFITLAVLFATVGAQANSSQTPDQVDLVQSLQQTDESSVRSVALSQAESFRSVPAQLRSQGVTVTPDQEQQFNQIADSLKAEAQKPGLKDRMTQELSKGNHFFSRVALDSLHAIGYSGSVAVSLMVWPFIIPGDFFSALVSGKGFFSDNTPALGEAAGYVSSSLGFFYTWVTVSIIAPTVIAPIIFGPMGIVAMDEILCKGSTDTSKNHNFCANNKKVLSTMMGGPAHLSIEMGAFIHNLIAKSIDQIFGIHHHPKPTVPPVPCSGVCSVYSGDVVIKSLTVTADSNSGDSNHDLADQCAEAANYYEHGWQVTDSTCPN